MTITQIEKNIKELLSKFNEEAFVLARSTAPAVECL